MKPLVGITAWRRTLDTYYGPDRLHTLSTFYPESVMSAGMVPVVFPAGQSPDAAGRLVSMVDGLILSGGDDVDPSTYGRQVTAATRFDAAVDRFEVSLVEAARKQGKPVLAICRGLQLLNVAMGGTLHQEVSGGFASHEPVSRETEPEEIGARRHVVRFEPGSVLAGAYGAAEAKVNTLHHQGIDRLAPGLVVEGRADDGLIEAVRCDGKWWALGVQWHPERMEDEHQSVFEAFREAVEGARRSEA
ncbi:MAG: gamma-glutamyl-gamma-aminobutyrate hydrolase family protein [Acidimicrobiia bacterium]